MSDQPTDETEQRYEYAVEKIGTDGIPMDNIAKDGWKFVGTVEENGTTNHIIFERPVGDQP